MSKQRPCGYMDETGTVICEAELEVRGDRYVCPAGGEAHRLASWDDLSPWLRDHIHYRQGEPTMHERFFGDRPVGDR